MKNKKLTRDERKELEIIYAMYGNAIKKIAYKFLHDEGLTEDCLHNVIVKLTKSLDKLGEYGSATAKSYIFTSAKHMAMDMLEKRSREIDFEFDDEFAEITGQLVFADKYFEEEESLSDGLAPLFEKLTESEREILTMFYFKRMNFTEIAEAVGKSHSAVMKQASRARMKLEKMIMENRGNVDD